MIEIDLRFKVLRVNLRSNGKAIATDVYKRYHPTNINPKAEICVFCSSSSDITKEHVLPKWLIESELHNTMTSSLNMQMAPYNKAVVPACSRCNNSILAYIENHIIKVIETIDTLNSSGDEDLCNIIRWMEVIDYKLQVLDCRWKYIKYGNSEYDRLRGIFPVAMMRHFSEMNPWIAYAWLRNSQRRITVKAKIVGINSLVTMTC